MCAEDDAVVIEVEDNGVGMEEAGYTKCIQIRTCAENRMVVGAIFIVELETM